MSDSTIPDALAADLRDMFLAAPPAGVTISADRVRFKHSDGEPPSPRLVILTGDPMPVAKMDRTAKVPVSIEYITSMDSITPEAHQQIAGKIDEWWNTIRGAKRRNVIVTRTYLHDLVTRQPSNSINKDQREQVTAIRGDLMVTLVAI
jgi:hypothetical protein